jgi:hypothetical protein
LDVGGLYQTTHEYFSGAGVKVSRDGVLEVLTSSSLVSLLLTVSGFAADFVRAKGTVLSLFVAGVAGAGAPEATFPKSNAVPGVFGVLVAEPNDAKAPVPKPNAEDAPVVGEATLFVVKGAMLLNGFERPPCELSTPPKRFEPEIIRDEEVFGSL